MKNINNYLHIALLLAVVMLFWCLKCEVDDADRVKCVSIEITLSAERMEPSEHSDNPEDIADSFIASLPDGAYGEGLTDLALRLGPHGILEELYLISVGEGSRIASFFLLLFGLSVLMSVSEIVLDGENDAVRRGAFTVGGFAVFSALYPVIISVKDSLEGINGLFGSFIPAFTALISLGGGTLGASAQSAGMGFTLWLFGGLGTALMGVLSPALIISASAFGLNDTTGGFFNGLNGAFTKLVGILTAVIAGVVSLQSFITSSADGAVLRAARYAATNLIPVVGGVVSGAMSTLSGGLSYAVGAVGGGAVAAILSVAVSPLLTLLLIRLCFFVCGSFGELIGASGTARFINCFSKSFDTLISVYALSVLIYIFEIILYLKCGVILI